MQIIDTHVHIYPDAIAQKAADAIGQFYDIAIHKNGTLDSLLESGKKGGISRFLIHSVATTPKQVESINRYLQGVGKEHPDECIPFGTMHPGYDQIPQELERMKQGGLQGVKVHPDFQKFLLDSPEALHMFRAIEAANLPVLIHMGDYRYPYSQPERMAAVLEACPRLRVIGAHLGGWTIWKEAWKVLAKYPNFWVDTSSSLMFLTPEEGAEIIRHYAPDHVFFGSDYPMWDPAEEVERFRQLPLTEEEKENIFAKNFLKFLKA